MNTSAANILEDFKDKDYAHAYMEEFLNAYIATQIKVLREKEGWTQEQLAEKADMRQERISLLESVNYSSWSINTLRKLAKAFDLVLHVSFENFSTGIMNFEAMKKESLQRVPREKDLYADQSVNNAAARITVLNTPLSPYAQNMVDPGIYGVKLDIAQTVRATSLNSAMERVA